MTLSKYQREVRSQVDDIAVQMVEAETLVEWHGHATEMLRELQDYSQEVAVHEFRASIGYVPLGRMVEA